jgi:hypothetical protein
MARLGGKQEWCSTYSGVGDNLVRMVVFQGECRRCDWP